MTEEQVERGSIMVNTNVERGKHLLYFRPGIGVLKFFAGLSSQIVLWAMLYPSNEKEWTESRYSFNDIARRKKKSKVHAYPWSIIRQVAEA